MYVGGERERHYRAWGNEVSEGGRQDPRGKKSTKTQGKAPERAQKLGDEAAGGGGG